LGLTRLLENQGGIFMTIFTGGMSNDSFNGGLSNDSISGGGGNDTLNGGGGDDTIYGGIGNDFLYGDIGNDFLSGDVGIDYENGGPGNDIYSHYMGGGVDYINEVNGGGVDLIKIPDITLSSIALYRVKNDLNICTPADWNYDGKNDSGVVIQNQFLGGNYTIELIAFSDNVIYYLPT